MAKAAEQAGSVEARVARTQAVRVVTDPVPVPKDVTVLRVELDLDPAECQTRSVRVLVFLEQEDDSGKWLPAFPDAAGLPIPVLVPDTVDLESWHDEAPMYELRGNGREIRRFAGRRLRASAMCAGGIPKTIGLRISVSDDFAKLPDRLPSPLTADAAVEAQP